MRKMLCVLFILMLIAPNALCDVDRFNSFDDMVRLVGRILPLENYILEPTFKVNENDQFFTIRIGEPKYEAELTVRLFCGKEAYGYNEIIFYAPPDIYNGRYHGFMERFVYMWPEWIRGWWHHGEENKELDAFFLEAYECIYAYAEGNAKPTHLWTDGQRGLLIECFEESMDCVYTIVY